MSDAGLGVLKLASPVVDGQLVQHEHVALVMRISRHLPGLPKTQDSFDDTPHGVAVAKKHDAGIQAAAKFLTPGPKAIARCSQVGLLVEPVVEQVPGVQEDKSVSVDMQNMLAIFHELQDRRPNNTLVHVRWPKPSRFVGIGAAQEVGAQKLPAHDAGMLLHPSTHFLVSRFVKNYDVQCLDDRLGRRVPTSPAYEHVHVLAVEDCEGNGIGSFVQRCFRHDRRQQWRNRRRRYHRRRRRRRRRRGRRLARQCRRVDAEFHLQAVASVDDGDGRRLLPAPRRVIRGHWVATGRSPGDGPVRKERPSEVEARAREVSVAVPEGLQGALPVVDQILVQHEHVAPLVRVCRHSALFPSTQDTLEDVLGGDAIPEEHHTWVQAATELLAARAEAITSGDNVRYLHLLRPNILKQGPRIVERERIRVKVEDVLAVFHQLQDRAPDGVLVQVRWPEPTRTVRIFFLHEILPSQNFAHNSRVLLHPCAHEGEGLLVEHHDIQSLDLRV
mmetsp:Transcript_49171/g.141122  ORF Transcript_49171/g.141122 Transcript_49171/m.141122 type:complete len:501 (+) Transcript_49171:229-1731(+)